MLSKDEPRPSEEDLFYLLIHKLRQREEQETANEALREQMKSDIVELSEENQSLRAQLEKSHSRQEEQEAEINTKRSQVEYWKVKISKLRRFLNGMRKECEALRDEANDLKEAEAGLVQEKFELVKCLSEIKVNVDQAASNVSQQPVRIASITEDFKILKLALRSAEEKVYYYHDRFIHEQKRVLKLERYIQNSENEHRNELRLTREMQSELVDKLNIAIDHVKQRWESSQTMLQSAICPVLQECLDSVNILSGKPSVEKRDLENLNSSVCGAISR